MHRWQYPREQSYSSGQNLLSSYFHISSKKRRYRINQYSSKNQYNFQYLSALIQQSSKQGSFKYKVGPGIFNLTLVSINHKCVGYVSPQYFRLGVYLGYYSSMWLYRYLHLPTCDIASKYTFTHQCSLS